MLAPNQTQDNAAYHDFLRRVKRFWSTELYASLKRNFDQAHSCAQANADEIEAFFSNSARYQFYGWLERNLQHLKYSSPRGILATVARDHEALSNALKKSDHEAHVSGTLRLDPDIKLPRYYSNVEFHQHPGGVWRDELAGVAYDFGRRTTMPAHIDPDEIHQRFTAAVPDADYKRILDLGCGTGRSTIPFAKRFPEAELHGLDLAAPCLRIAAMRSQCECAPVYWWQGDAAATTFASGNFDLIHSTFLLHELPTKALIEVTREVYRLLAPGGYWVSLDFHSPPGGAYAEFIHYGHAFRNNEVFMRSFCETDYLSIQRECGFVDVEMKTFDDGGGIFERDQLPPIWRFPSQLFVARKAG